MANVIFLTLEDTAANVAASKRALLLAFDSTNKKWKYFDASTTEYELLTLDSTGTPTRAIGDLETAAITSVGDVDIGADANNKLVIQSTSAYLVSNGTKIVDYLHSNGYVSIGGDGDDLDVAIFGTDLVNPIFWSDAGNKRIGIGTDAPLSKLHVVNSSEDLSVYLQSLETKACQVLFYDGSVAGSIRYDHVTDKMYFRGKGTNADIVTLGNAGLVGIGTTSPTKRLEVKNNAVNDYAIAVQRTGGSEQVIRLGEDASGHGLLVVADNTQSVKIALKAQAASYINTGYGLGIGLTSPTNRLEVKNTAVDTACIAVQRSGGTQQIVRLGEDASGHGRVRVLDNGQNDKIVLNAQADSYINTGNGLAIGAATVTSGKKLDVTGDTLITGNLALTGNITAPKIARTGYIDTGTSYNTPLNIDIPLPSSFGDSSVGLDVHVTMWVEDPDHSGYYQMVKKIYPIVGSSNTTPNVGTPYGIAVGVGASGGSTIMTDPVASISGNNLRLAVNTGSPVTTGGGIVIKLRYAIMELNWEKY